ncbi:MAG: AEC family transporter [Anaerocolumna sp.]
MEGFLLSFKVVFPMCILMVLGYLLKRGIHLTDATLKQINKMIFTIFLPVVLFRNIYTSDLIADVNPLLLVFGGIASTTTFFILYFLMPHFVKNRRDAATMVQGIFRSNNVLFGLTIVESIYPGGEVLGMISVLAAFTVFIYNILVVFLFESYRDAKMNIRKVMTGVIKNPMIIGIIVGILLLFSGIKLPDMVMDVVSDVGGIATPLALIVLGGTFTFQGINRYRSKLIVSALGKLIVIPALVLPIAVLIGFRGPELVALMALFSSPTAVASFTMSDQMGGNGELAALIIVATSICSVFTLFLWTFLGNLCGMI